MHWISIVLSLIPVITLCVLLSVSWIEKHQSQNLQQLPSYKPVAPATTANAAVVYFSRSGNTALVARHVAQRLGAHLYPLEAPDYQLGLGGLAHALNDASSLKAKPEALPEIVPSTIDLTRYASVWLGSPVWLYSPAPPLWSFVEKNRFDGQRVVLFNTYNSHIGDDHIASLKAKVMARGALSFEHKHVLRGRMTQQLTPEQMLKAIDKEWFMQPQL